MIPLPQAHHYLLDPLSKTGDYDPQCMVRVDFAFWTGKRIVAVEIDGGSHIGGTTDTHVKKGRAADTKAAEDYGAGPLIIAKVVAVRIFDRDDKPVVFD